MKRGCLYIKDREGKRKVKLDYEIRKRNGMQVIKLPCLDLVTQGRDEREAIHNLKEAFLLFLESEREVDDVFIGEW